MSFSISAVSQNGTNYDATSAPKQTAKPTGAEQIKQLASEGHSAKAISSLVGLPETIVDAELGTTTTTTSSTSQASALLSLSARLSVQA